MLEELKSFSRNSRLFLLSNIVYYTGAGIFFLVFNIYVVEGLYYSEYFLGILLSASSFAAALFSLPAGIIGDRIGRKPCLLGGTAATALSMALLATFESQSLLILANALLGFSTTLTLVSFNPFMMENTSQKERVYLFSVNGAVTTLGYTVGAFIGGVLPDFFAMSRPESLRATLLVSVIFCCIGIIPLLILTEKKKETFFTLKIVKSISLTEKFVLIQVICGFGAGLIVPFFNIFFRMNLGVSIQMIGTIFAVGNIVTGVAIFAAAPIASRWGKVRSIVITELGSLPFLLMIAYSPFVVLAAFGYMARGALMNMGGPISSAFMMEQVKEEERATVNGIVTAGWHSSWAASNIVAGALMNRNLYETPFLITSFLYGVGSVLYYWFFAALEKTPVLSTNNQY
jgi:MFS family permease